MLISLILIFSDFATGRNFFHEPCFILHVCFIFFNIFNLRTLYLGLQEAFQNVEGISHPSYLLKITFVTMVDRVLIVSLVHSSFKLISISNSKVGLVQLRFRWYINSDSICGFSPKCI